MKFFEKIDDLILCKFPTIWKYKLHVLTIVIFAYFLIVKVLYYFIGKQLNSEVIVNIIDLFVPFLILATYLKLNQFNFFQEYKINHLTKFTDYIKDLLSIFYIAFLLVCLNQIIRIYVQNLYSNIINYFSEYIIGLLFFFTFNLISIKFLKLKKFFILYILILIFLIIFNFVENYHHLGSIVIILGLMMLIYFLRKNPFVDLIYNLYLIVLLIIIAALFKKNEILNNDKIGIIFLFLFCVIQYIGLIIINNFPKRA